MFGRLLHHVPQRQVRDPREGRRKMPLLDQSDLEALERLVYVAAGVVVASMLIAFVALVLGLCIHIFRYTSGI